MPQRIDSNAGCEVKVLLTLCVKKLAALSMCEHNRGTAVGLKDILLLLRGGIGSANKRSGGWL